MSELVVFTFDTETGAKEMEDAILQMQKMQLIELEDAETGERIAVDFRGLRSRRDYSKRAEGDFRSRKELFRSLGIDSIDIVTDKPYLYEILKFFRMRERKL